MKRFIIFLFLILLLFFSDKNTLAFEYTIEPSLLLSEEYNDNIFLSSEETDDDFITFVTPGINLSMKSATSELRIDYAPSFSYYTSHDELNETAHIFSAKGNFTLSERLNLTLSDAYVKSTEISDIRDIPDLGPIARREEWRLHSIDGNISYRLSEVLSCTLGASYFDSNYRISDPDLSEVKSYSGNIDFSYRYSEKTTFTLDAEYRRDDIRPFSDATIQSYMLGTTYMLTSLLSARVRGGAIITKIEDTGKSDTVFGGDIDLTRTFEKGSATIFYRQNVITGIMTEEPVTGRTARLSLTRDITSKLTASILAFLSHFESIETNNIESEETGFRTELAYNFSPWAVLSLSYSYTDFDDKIDDTGYYNNIVFLNLRLSYNKRL